MKLQVAAYVVDFIKINPKLAHCTSIASKFKSLTVILKNINQRPIIIVIYKWQLLRTVRSLSKT